MRSFFEHLPPALCVVPSRANAGLWRCQPRKIFGRCDATAAVGNAGARQDVGDWLMDSSMLGGGVVANVAVANTSVLLRTACLTLLATSTRVLPSFNPFIRYPTRHSVIV